MPKRALNIGITAGDPAGIGPEVSLKAINSIRDDAVIPILFCRKAVLETLYPDIFHGYISIDLNTSGAASALEPGKKYLYDISPDIPLPVPGRGSAETGRESREYIDRAIKAWRQGAIDAIVTGPVSKGYIEKSGVHFTGHTEYLAEKIGESGPLMMMFSPRYRVLLATTHMPLARVTGAIDEERLLFVMRAGYEGIRSIDGDGVMIAVTGLDPHCGDNGAIGSFDREITRRGIERARAEGLPVEGPFAADTLFIPAVWERYNLVIALYHDQGLIPFKMLAFDHGVNVTLGLSLVRTSVDHGTAYDIAGKNAAGFTSMVEAIMLAKKLAERKPR